MGKAFEKQINTIKDQGEKQVEALNTFKFNNAKLKNKNKDENIFPKNAFTNNEAKDEFNKVIELAKNIDREKLLYNAGKYKYDFRKSKTLKTFSRDIYEGKISLEQADEEQSYLANEIDKFSKETKPIKKQYRRVVFKYLRDFLNATEMVLNGFKSKIFLTESIGIGILNTNHSKLKILTPKQMLQRLPIALAQVKAGNNSESLLNEIR